MLQMRDLSFSNLDKTSMQRNDPIDSTCQSIRTHQIPSIPGSNPNYRLQSAEECIIFLCYRKGDDWCSSLVQYICPFAIQRMVSNCDPWIRSDIRPEGDMGKPVLRGIGVWLPSCKSGEYDH
jgi:hypothetical protein